MKMSHYLTTVLGKRATSVGLRFVKLKHMLDGSSSSEADISNIAGITA